MENAIHPAWVWCLAGSIFLAGCLCLALRRQLLAMILGVELMVNAANLALVFYAVRYQDARALAVALLVVALAAAEAVVGISLLLALYRSGGITEAEQARTLAG